jgi:hypothetical protein
MYCPHCGVENEQGNRYCVGCGSELARSGTPPARSLGPREWIERLIGTTRRARLLSAATVGAVVIAIVAFVLLEPGADTAAEDSFTALADRTCVTHKQTIAALEWQVAQRQVGVSAFAGALVSVVEEWRQDLQRSPVPPKHAEGVQALNSALLDVVIEAGALARIARGGDSAQTLTQAGLVDEATARVGRTVDDLGLSNCSEVEIGPVAADRR